MRRTLRRLVVSEPAAVTQIAEIAGVLDDPGDVLLPLPPSETDRARVLGAVGNDPVETDEPVVLAVATTGSTGVPKIVLHTPDSLRASAAAADARMGGPGQWLLALPAHHVAGINVILRGALAGNTPVVCDAGGPGFVDTFAARVAAMTGPRRYVSLVPTQLARLLESPTGAAAAAELDVVLVGGAASDPALLERARDAGVTAVTTYGGSETCGGCVYDGVPLGGVSAEVIDGTIELRGPVVAAGYLVDGGVLRLDGQFRTSDLGRFDGGRLQVLGRSDDLIVTGGEKVAPAEVEAAIRRLPGISDVLVVGTPSERWGSAVCAVVVGLRRDLPDLRAELVGALASYQLPQQAVWVDAIPTMGIGKPDRAAAARLFTPT